ncbi:MAG: hypothetical protein AMS27_14035 [Bacteroides sp. SM23_62_1]|nr:MAG: hypothetical protein AMS27_14035 [Bacteroides sp. SM23_62_1]
MDEKERKKKKQFEKICKKVGKAINEYQLIQDSDRVLVGLSGGKDSMILLEALADRKKHLPLSFELFAVHISAKNVGYEMDTCYLAAFCEEISVPLYLEEVEIDISLKPEKTPCFICSWNRRKKIFEKSKELRCNKVALGHHKDDAIQTMLMNMIYHGSFSSLPQKLRMFNGRIDLIRPLLTIPENELAYYAGLKNLKEHEKSCPYMDSTKRNTIKELIRSLDKLHKDSRKNLFRAMDNIYYDYLPKKSC